MRLRTLLVTTLCLTLAPAAFGQRDKLKVGDLAPGLDIEEWVRGRETGLDSGKVYIVEFWATWCIPCRQSIPHLSELQQEYGDQGLTIIGVSTEELDVVRPWVAKMGKNMDYTVAVDRRKGTNRAWMQAAGEKGIPTAFIVDRAGKIAYIGTPHPKYGGMEMESILERVLMGRFDPALEARAAPMLHAARSARKTNTFRLALKQYDEVIELSPKVFAEVAIERYMMMLVDMESVKEANEYGRDRLMQEYFSGDPGALQMMAEMIATDPRIDDEDRDMDMALEAAAAAQKMSDGTMPETYATLALVNYHRGEVREAVRLQRRAWMLARPRSKPEYKRDLNAYQAAAGRTSGLGR